MFNPGPLESPDSPRPTPPARGPLPFLSPPAVIFAVFAFLAANGILMGAPIPASEQKNELTVISVARNITIDLDSKGSKVLIGAPEHSGVHTRVQSLLTGETLFTLTGHTGPVRAVAVAPDDAYLLTGSDDHTARLWCAETGESIRVFQGHSEPVHAVAFSGDGRRIATGASDGSTKLWDTATGELLATYEVKNERADSVALSSDGEYVLTGGTAMIAESRNVLEPVNARLWRIGSDQPVLELVGHEHAITSVAISPNEKWMLTGSFDHTVRLWCFTSGKQLRTLEGHTAAVQSVAFASDSAKALSAASNGVVRLWDLDAGQETQVFRVGGRGGIFITKARFYSGDAKVIACTYRWIVVWDVKTGLMKVLNSTGLHDGPLLSH